MPIGASGEDVDLFLEEELWIDVKLSETDITQLATLLEQQRQHLLQLQSLHTANPAAHPAPATQPAASPITPATLRRWHEAEVRAVDGRNIRVHFLNIPLPPQWINVDEGWERLSELHIMTEREREGLTGTGAGGPGSGTGNGRGEELDLTVDVDEVFDEVVEKAGLGAFVPVVGAGELRNGRREEYDERLRQVKEEFIRRWFTSSSSSSSSSSASTHAVGGEVKESELELLDSEDIVSESVTIPLFDPLTRCRLIVPVRTAACTHCHCSDLMTHIQHQKAKLDWTCLCGKEAYANQLQVDLFLFAILQSVRAADGADKGGSSGGVQISHEFGEVSETRHVVISRDGSWRVDDRAERDRKKRKRAAMESGATVSQSPTSSTSASSSATSSLSSAAAASSASSSSSSSSSSFSCPFPVELRTVVSDDDIEYIDVRDEQPSDADILAWLMQRMQVKQEKLASERASQQQQHPMEESKSPFFSSPPQPPSILPSMSSSGALHYPFARPGGGSAPLTNSVSIGAYGAQSSSSLPSSHPRLLSSYTAPSPSSSSSSSYTSPTIPSGRSHHTTSRSGRPGSHHTHSSRRTASASVVTIQPAPNPPPPSAGSAATEPLNINTCTEWQLRRVGIAVGVCEKIIAARRERGDVGFESVEELREIKGIGAKTYAKLIEKVVM